MQKIFWRVFLFRLLSNLNEWKESINEYLVFYPLSPFLSIILVIEEKVRWDVEATKQNVALDNCPHMHSPTQPGKYLEQLKANMADFKSELLFTFKKLKFTYIKLLQKALTFIFPTECWNFIRYSSVFLKVISFHICKRSTFQSSNSRDLDFREKKLTY